MSLVSLDLFTFTYLYGNGDYYTGQGYAEAGTYAANQVFTGYANETGYEGSYTINSVDNSGYDSGSGYNNFVYVTSYYDGDTGAGSATTSAGGYSGLGSESGSAYVYGSSAYDTFSNYDEADLYFYPPTIDQYNFTYYYGNDDFYSGSGFASTGTYYAGQTIDSYWNETGNNGYYIIDSVYSPIDGSDGQVYVNSYYDGDASYSYALSVSGYGYSGLGSESGTVTGSYNSDDFSNYSEADFYSYISYDQYNFTYYYGNGDSYSGYGYVLTGTYYAGQTISPYPNETGNDGYYYIDSVYYGSGGSDGQVYVSSYYDGDTSFSTYLVSGLGYSGLGSEFGTVSGSSSDSFSNYYEADLLNSSPTLANDLASAILGSGVAIINPSFIGDSRAASLFNDSSLGIGILSGIILSTGDVANIYGPNDSDSTTTAFGTSGDYDLNSLVTPSSTQDAAVLEFDFVPTQNFLSFSYVFASEEYNEYVNSSFNDVFGFFLTDSFGNKQNIAIIPGTTTPIAINNINLGSNPAYYLNNDLSDYGFGTTPFNTEFDGLTTVLTAIANVNPGETYRLKLAIADNSDQAFDSAVFITGGTFETTPIVAVNDSVKVNQDQPITINVLANDVVASGEIPIIGDFQVISDNGGTITLFDNGTPDNLSDDQLIYTPSTGFTGIDEFEYTLADSAGNTDTAGVYVEVSPVSVLVSDFYYFTYNYGDDNQDYYEGYGYVAGGTYYEGQILESYPNETGNNGYYTIGAVYSGYTEVEDEVTVTSYYDVDTGYGSVYSIFGSDASILGTESGDVYDANGNSFDSQFSNYYEADVVNTLLSDFYYFTYNYGNDNQDYYEGYGYVAGGTYYEGQILESYPNETGNNGYYTIGAVYSGYTEVEDEVTVTSYYDVDTGYGSVYSIFGSDASILGTESGDVYDANGNSFDSQFSNYYEADLSAEVGVVQVRLNLLADDGGNPGELIANNQIGVNKSFFVEILVADLRGNAVGVNGLGLDLSWDGFILESINFDPSLDITSQFPLLQDGTLVYDGFIDDLSGGSLPEFELGQAIGVNQLERFALLHFYTENSSNGTSYFTTTVDSASLADDASYSLDVEENQPIEILSSYNQYNFTYNYGNGDFYTGYVYALEGTYAAGQVLEGYYNETGNYGSYTIDSIASSTFESYYNNQIYVTSYYDGDTGYGYADNLTSYTGYSGLGSEYGYAYDSGWSSSDSYFDRYYEADILGNQLFNYTYHYGNGDSYSGYGYAAVDTYAVGQTIDYGYNETGNYGYYTIDSVELGNTSTGYNGYIYVTSYYDADTGFGTAGYVNSGTGYSGLTSEYGYAYDSNGYSSDSYFNYSSEADILNQYYTFTYTYGNGDSYSGYGYALAGTYAAEQVLSGYWNETGNYGSYTIDSVSAGTADSSYNNQIYVTSYYDGDTGYGYADNLTSYTGYSGLGSEYGYAYDSGWSSSDSYFDRYYEADILGNQLFNYTYHYGNGDSYSGHGYAAVGTYTAGQTIGYYPNETIGTYPGGTGAIENDTLGYSFYGDSVYRLSYTFTNLSDALTLNFIGSGLQEISDESWGLDNVKVTAGAFNYFNDFESDSATGWSSSNRSTTPVGSRNFLGEFGNDTVSVALNDADLNGSVTVEFDLFILKSWDGIGSLGIGGTDHFALTTSNGQTLLNTTFAKYPGQLQSYPDNGGYYTIDSVELGNTDSSYNGSVYINSYTDGDTSYAYGTTTNLSVYNGYYGLGSEYGYAYTAEGISYDSYFSNYYEADLVVPSISITDNSGDASDASIKFTTELSKFRKNYSDSDFVRPNYADSSKYFDITNTGTGVLSVSGIQINVTGVTTDLDLTGGDLLINPNESQRVKLTYDAAAAKESFNLSNGLVLFTNAVDIPEFAIALSGKSTFNSDINYDGKVNTGDLGSLNQATKNYKQKIFDPTADINGDGLFSNADVLMLQSENKSFV